MMRCYIGGQSCSSECNFIICFLLLSFEQGCRTVLFVIIHEITKAPHFLLQIWCSLIPKVFHDMFAAVSY
jgi:hypothetical protein